jgi:serine/threonine protein kinase
VPLVEELAREVLLLRACHDRNIVSFVGASIQAGHAVLVTEYMPNGDLHAALAAMHAKGTKQHGTGAEAGTEADANLAKAQAVVK